MIKSIKSIFKGVIGEFKANMLNHLAVSNDFKILNNVTIPLNYQNNNQSDKVNTTQIDSILIGRGKIIVVEIKNYKGDVYGDVSNKDWELKYGSHQSYQTHNPLFQNYAHIKAIQDLIKEKTNVYIPLTNFESIIYYNGDGKINITNNKKNSKNTHLFHDNCIVDNIKSYLSNINQSTKIDLPHNITEEMIFQKIDDADLTKGVSLKSFNNYRQHVKQQKRRFG